MIRVRPLDTNAFKHFNAYQIFQRPKDDTPQPPPPPPQLPSCLPWSADVLVFGYFRAVKATYVVPDIINICLSFYERRPFQNLIECELNDFETVGILGVGKFARVSLVKDTKSATTYALKKVRKNKVVEDGQQQNIRRERAVMASLNSDFICRLFAVYQDHLNVYFCVEAVLGGELFTMRRWNRRFRRRYFGEKTARFYSACVVLAFEHMHSKNIIYRDLKPENVLIAANGYCKLIDFGHAKERPRCSRTIRRASRPIGGRWVSSFTRCS